MIQICYFSQKISRKNGKSRCRKFFEEFFNQFFVKTVERSTDEEETKMTTAVTPIQENYFKIPELLTTKFLQKEISKNVRSRKILETMSKLK